MNKLIKIEEKNLKKLIKITIKKIKKKSKRKRETRGSESRE
jgi:hypothetical protein